MSEAFGGVLEQRLCSCIMNIIFSCICQCTDFSCLAYDAGFFLNNIAKCYCLLKIFRSYFRRSFRNFIDILCLHFNLCCFVFFFFNVHVDYVKNVTLNSGIFFFGWLGLTAFKLHA